MIAFTTTKTTTMNERKEKIDPAPSCLFVRHTNFKPVPGGGKGASAVEEHALESHLNLAKANGYDESEIKLLRSCVQGHNSVEIGGLLYGVFQAWKDEKCVGIAPHHLWYNIVAQVAKTIKSDPKSFHHIFSKKKSGKQNIILTTIRPDYAAPERLVTLLKQKIATPGLAETVCSPFPTELVGEISLEEVMSTVLLEAASPFFNYFSTLCGLRGVSLEGSKEDWDELVRRIKELRAHLGGIKSGERYYTYTLDDVLLKKAHARAIDLCNRVKKGNEADNAFVENCFGVSVNCGSGHAYHAHGWIFDFFESKVLRECGTPISYVSWLDLDTGRKFYQAYGLTHGEYDTDEVLRMSFSRWTYEVFSDDLFHKIKG